MCDILSIINNTIRNNLGTGIALMKSNLCTASENIITDNNKRGIRIDTCTGTKILGNTITNSTLDGVYFFGSHARATQRQYLENWELVGLLQI